MVKKKQQRKKKNPHKPVKEFRFYFKFHLLIKMYRNLLKKKDIERFWGSGEGGRHGLIYIFYKSIMAAVKKLVMKFRFVI